MLLKLIRDCRIGKFTLCRYKELESNLMDARLYNLHPDECQRVTNYFESGMPVARLESYDDFGAWKIINRGSRRWLMQHYNRALMWVEVADGKAISFELITGDAAQAIEKQL